MDDSLTNCSSVKKAEQNLMLASIQPAIEVSPHYETNTDRLNGFSEVKRTIANAIIRSIK